MTEEFARELVISGIVILAILFGTILLMHIQTWIGKGQK